MPIRKVQRTRLSDMDPEVRDYLESGRVPSTVNESRAYMMEHDVAEAAWRDRGSELMAAWIRRAPGSRPWAWWKWGLPTRTPATPPARRNKLSGSGSPAEDWGEDAFGLPVAWRGFDAEDPPRYESEVAYLRRLELMAPSEDRRVKRRGEPVVLLPPALGVVTEDEYGEFIEEA